MVAHTLAKSDPQFNSTTIFFPKTLPLLAEVAWFRDFRLLAVTLLLFEWKLHFLAKKKKKSNIERVYFMVVP